METNYKWNAAARDGLLLSLVTIIFSLVSSVFTPRGILAVGLWAVKFGGCLYLLHHFMKKYAEPFDRLDYRQSFSFGTLVCLFSSIICACFAFASLVWLFPDTADQVAAQIEQTMAARHYTPEQENAVTSMMNRLPQIMFFGTFVYYFIFGVAASAVTANFTKKDNPFGDSGEDL